MTKVIVSSVLVLLGAGTCIAAECQAPNYRVGHVWEDRPSSIMMNVSIRMSDFAPDRLICLAAALKRQYSTRDRISILIFSNHTAARNYTTPVENHTIGPPTHWSRSCHAVYSLDADKREESLTLMPIGLINRFTTVIRPPFGSPPACTLGIAGRCLLALDDITFPDEALRAMAHGTVTMAGTIVQHGQVKHLRAITAKRPAGGIQNLFVRAALRNLNTWRFEAARKQATIRITYEYVIDHWAVSSYPDNIRFDLPHKVEVTGVPPRKN